MKGELNVICGLRCVSINKYIALRVYVIARFYESDYTITAREIKLIEDFEKLLFV